MRACPPWWRSADGVNGRQNTQWVEWPARSGIDAYRIRFDYYENNALVANPTHNTPNGGSIWVNWSGVRTLQHGGQYGLCAQGQYSLPNDSLWFPDGPNSCSMGTTLGRRTHTTIDRSKPTAALQLAAGAAFVKNTNLALKVDFADDVAGPFPDPDDDDPTDPGEAHRLRVDAPGKARARAEFIPVQLTATDRGKVQLQLLDGEKVLVRATLRLDPDGTADHRLKLRKGTAPGRYVLKATWKPARSETITKLRNIRLIQSPPVRRASASSRPGVVVATGPRALPDGAFHGAARRARSR